MIGDSLKTRSSRKRRHLAALSFLCLGAILAFGSLALRADAPVSGTPTTPKAKLDASSTAIVAPPYSEPEILAFCQRADMLRLHIDPYWFTLLHWDGRQSRVDDPVFFVAPNGKRDLRAELQTTLKLFFSTSAQDGKNTVDRFPARQEWLCEKLGIDRARLPVPVCSELENAIRSLDPRSTVVVFPAAYMNTPASMFGHTLITVRGRRHSELMNQAVNYAASIPPNTNGIVFAAKGIFGGYPGYYSLMPYYKKVQEYSGMDQRDLWEYELSLSKPEIRRMLLHVWEMRNIYSDYFFFGENCSFNLLYLLDAARPGLKLAAHFEGVRFWVVPLDTIKAMRASGLIEKAVYRPSLATQVRTHAAQLTAEQAALAREVGNGTLPPATVAGNPAIAKETAGRILDLGAEYLQSLRGRRKIAQADYQPRYFAILAERSKLPAAPADTDTADSAKRITPDTGHDSERLSLGLGGNQGRMFGEIGYRAAYHDMMDSDTGFVRGSEIQFGNLALRWYGQQERLQLERLDLIRLRSFSVRDRFYSPVSWELGTGIVHERTVHTGNDLHMFYLDGGPGMSWGFGGGALLYALMEGDLRIGGLDEGGALGFGPKAGFVLPITARWQLHAYGKWTNFVVGASARNWEAGLQQRYTLSRNTALLLEAARRQTWEFPATEISIKLLLYF